LATTQKRVPPRKAATPQARTAPANRSKTAAATAPAKKKPAMKKAPATKRPATGKTVAAKKATPAKNVAPRSGKALAKAGPVKAPRSAKAKAPKVLDAGARLRQLVLAALADLKAKDVTEVDVRGKSSVTDLMVVASGTSSRHVKSIADEVVKKAKQSGLPPIGVEGQREAEWVLVDLGDVIVHVMLPRTREFYSLERLWTVGDEMPATLAG
jgi:ribosome silencing factor RsfS/YbeB/iojap